MRRSVVVVIALSGCHAVLGIDEFHTIDAGDIDAPADAEIDAPSDSLTCFGTLKSICFTMPPTGDLMLSGTIDTSTDARCANYPQMGGVDLCVIAGATVTAGAVRVQGTKPLVVVGMTMVSITGSIDASSIGTEVGGGANGAGCTVTTGQAQSSGGGGGGGGGFGVAGAGGGLGANGAMPGPSGAPIGVTQIRGGCPGGKGGDGEPGSGGRLGASGGAIAVLAGTAIQVAGGVYASGAGGGGGSPLGTLNRGAGGGGGSGGLIVLEAPTINVTGTVAANGGGGGGGADAGTGFAGTDGTRMNYNVVPLGGNNEGGTHGGDGGDGGYVGGSAKAGREPGVGGGGGGGGGGVGVIWVHGALTGSNRFSPVPQMH